MNSIRMKCYKHEHIHWSFFFLSCYAKWKKKRFAIELKEEEKKYEKNKKKINKKNR